MNSLNSEEAEAYSSLNKGDYYDLQAFENFVMDFEAFQVFGFLQTAVTHLGQQ